MVDLTYIRQGVTPKGKINSQYTYYDYKGRKFVKFRDEIISVAWADSGHLLTISKRRGLSVAGHTVPNKFSYKEIFPLAISEPPTNEELSLCEMLYPGYTEFRVDLDIFRSLMNEGERLDNDFETLLILFQQAEERYHESQRSLQTSQYNTSGN